MTPSELKAHVQAGTETHFFDRDTMRFFGDTMRNYGVRSAVVTTEYNAAGEYVKEGITRDCWELFRKHAVKHGLKDSAYFDKATFARVFPSR